MELALQSQGLSSVVLVIFVLAAALIDLRHCRIPNWLTLSLLSSGVVLQIVYAGVLDGTLTAISGILVALLIFLPFWLMGGMGAGDVKLMAAIGSFFGGLQTLLVAGLTLGLGCVMGLLYLIYKRAFVSFLARYVRAFKLYAFSRELILVESDGSDASTHRFPYGLAIAGGTFTAMWLLSIAMN